MALPLYDVLQEGRHDSSSSRPSLDHSARFSIDEDDPLNELDPLHSASLTSKFEYEESAPAYSGRPQFGNLLSRRKPLGFLARKEARDEKIDKLKKTFLVPGRIFLFVALVVASIGLAAVGGGGYWAYKRGTKSGDSPPWYPTPKGGTVKSWEESYRKATLLVSDMTLLEKVNITTGTGWMMGPCVGNTAPATGVGFPALCLQDGPLGVRFADHVSATPAGITVGATWNKDLMYKRGKMLGLENRLKGVNIMLGPAVGPLGRMPAGGRNWEGFGSDPVLQGWAASQTIRGIQEEGVIATIKHFIGNEQEHFRQSFEWGLPNAISSNIDDRTLHEVYAWPFADSVRAGVASVMCSYNQVNNSYACQNSKLLNGILKDELGFQGFVQSDWLAQRSGVASALAGLDMSMPGDGLSWADGESIWGPRLTLGVLNGSLPMERLDDMVTRIVAAWYQLGQDDKAKWPRPSPNFSSWTNQKTGLIHAGSDDKTTAVVNQFVDVQRMGGYSHSSLVRRVAAEATILLKNDNATLPLSRNGYPQSTTNENPSGRKYRIAIFGEDSTLAKGGANACTDRGCNEGTLASGWGSGAVEFPYLVSPLESLQHGFHGNSVDASAFPTNRLPSESRNTGIEDQDLCIVFVNADAGEGYIAWDGVRGDRNDLNLQKGGDALIRDVAVNCGSNHRNVSAKAWTGTTIVVIHSVGAVVLESFIDDPNIGAVLYANLPGQESGHALADVLFGDFNPSGHLPYTIGKTLDDYGPGAQVLYRPNGIIPQQDFTEGLLVDYRWFDMHNITPRFPFGYGLSYTTFDLRNLNISSSINTTRPEPLPKLRTKPEISPPQYNSTIPPLKDLLFPSGWRKLKKYVYPYLDVDDVVAQSKYPYPNMTSGVPSAAGGGEGGNPSLWDILVDVEVTVVNTGYRDGQVVVQLYVVFPEEVWEEIRQNTEGTGNQRLAEGQDGDHVETEDLQARQVHDAGAGDMIDLMESANEKETTINNPSVDDEASSGPQSTTPEDGDGFNEMVNDIGSDDQSGPDAAINEAAVESQYHSNEDETLPVKEPLPEPPIAAEESTFEDFQPDDVAQGAPSAQGAQTANLSEAESIMEDFPAEDPTEEQPSSSQPTSTSPTQSQPIPPQRTSYNVISRERIPFPRRVLRAFEKVNTYTTANGDLSAQDMQTVRFQLTRRDLSYWSVRQQNWVIPDGSFGIEVGFDSRDLRLKGVVF